MQYFQRLNTAISQNWAALGGAILFYTRYSLPANWPVRLVQIAYLAPWVGCGLGALVALADYGFELIHFPLLTRAVLLVGFWLWSTGGLHMDGAMDTADGLAVFDPERRLAVMRDSVSGAFGVMAAVVILLLKCGAIAELDTFRGWSFVMAAGWGRWGQVVAIARYPYLRPEGKGAFHKTTFRNPWDWLWGLGLLLGLMVLQMVLVRDRYLDIALGALWGMGLSLFVSAWFARQFDGHTGDTYGAVVEWVEALYLVGILGLSGILIGTI